MLNTPPGGGSRGRKEACPEQDPRDGPLSLCASAAPGLQGPEI